MDAQTFERIVAEQGARIARLQEEFQARNGDEPGMVRMPFRCCLCERESFRFALMTGDGLPACEDCLEGVAAAGAGVPT